MNRLALAAAVLLMQRHADILIIDEATFVPDPLAESINQMLSKMPDQVCAPAVDPTFKGKRVAQWQQEKNRHRRHLK